MDMVTISKEEFENLKSELETLRNSRIYKRLLDFEINISKYKYSRKDLGF
jgi:PHD/YefM family antitoxin component YafN of YafNO toxin-antitoxin module